MSAEWSVVTLPGDAVETTIEPVSDWWERVGVPLVEQLKAGAERDKECEKAEAWAQLMNIRPDGKTVHILTRLQTPSPEWSYQAFDVAALVELATTIVLARDNAEQLGTIH